MVKLYYSPNSAGAAAFLAACAGGVSLETEQVDLRWAPDWAVTSPMLIYLYV